MIIEVQGSYKEGDFLSQPPLKGLPGPQRLPHGTSNHAWLSLDLLEVLCLLAESGYASGVRSLLECPLKNCPELLLFGMAQIKVSSLRRVLLETLDEVVGTFFSGHSFRWAGGRQ